jgi:flagellar assembly protein FliH
VILRGAVLSEKRLALDSQVTELAATAQSRAGAQSKSPDLGTRTREPVVPEPPLVAVQTPTPPPAPPPITPEAVKKWLDGASVGARAEITAALADDIEALRSAARTQGFERGHAEGLAQAAERSRQAIAALERLVEQAEIAFDDATAVLATHCADIVCEAFTKIAGPMLATREAALGAVLEVLKRVRDERALVIRVSPADIQVLREYEKEIARACTGREYSLLADPRVGAGGCIVESPLGGFDGRFDVQLRGVCETLRAAKSASVEAP